MDLVHFYSTLGPMYPIRKRCTPVLRTAVQSGTMFPPFSGPMPNQEQCTSVLRIAIQSGTLYPVLRTAVQSGTWHLRAQDHCPIRDVAPPCSGSLSNQERCSSVLRIAVQSRPLYSSLCNASHEAIIIGVRNQIRCVPLSRQLRTILYLSSNINMNIITIQHC